MNHWFRQTVFLVTALLALSFSLPAMAVDTDDSAEVHAHAHEGTWICPMKCDGLTFDEPGDCPVCKMHLKPVETRPAQKWVCPMECDGLVFDEPGDCPICKMHLKPQKPETAEGFFDADAIESASEIKKETALMPGLTTTHFWIGVVFLFFLTLGLAVFMPRPTKNMEKTSKRWDYPRFELTKWGWFKRLVKWRYFQPMLQLPVVLLFLLVIAAGIFGSQDPAKNIAPVLTWNIWWMGLIFFAFFAGEIWCTVCPWMAIPDWVSRAGAWVGKKSRPLGLHRRWPRWARNLYPAIGMFVVITWLELAYEVPYRPFMTAMMAVAMVGMAAVTLFVFEHKGFCRHVCLVGRVTGAYGTTGMLEIRRKDTSVCHSCQTKDCLHGNEHGLPCPTREFMGAMNENTYCTMCTECLKTCPHDNIGLNVRAPLADLMGPHRKRLDEAWLLVMIIIVTWFHGLAMVPFWTREIIPPLREWAAATFFDPGYLPTFTAAMTAFFGLCVAAYWAGSWLILKASGNVFYRVKDTFIAYAYPFLPIALAYHLAHNALHFFYEGSKLIRLASDPFGYGWDLFGTVDNNLTMLIPIEYLWVSQVILVLLGQMASVWLVRRTSFRMFANKRQATRATVVAAVILFALSVLSLWLLNQPMEMRTA